MATEVAKMQEVSLATDAATLRGGRATGVAKPEEVTPATEVATLSEETGREETALLGRTAAEVIFADEEATLPVGRTTLWAPYPGQRQTGPEAWGRWMKSQTSFSVSTKTWLLRWHSVV